MPEDHTGDISPKAHGGEGAENIHRSGETGKTPGSGKSVRSGEKPNPVVLLLFMILMMVVVLAAISLRGGGPSDSDGRSEDPVLAALKADVDARRSELNRQRMAMGLPALKGESEPIADIAARLKEDTDALVGRAAGFPQMLGDKDAEISRINGEVLNLGKRLQAVGAENSRLKDESARALFAASEAERLRESADRMQARQDELSREVADLRSQLAEKAGAVNREDHADLQRRYDEVLRSKAFFENRVNELEALANRTNLFAKSEDELLPAAVEVFRNLRKLEDIQDPDLANEYGKLGADLGASVLHTLNFGTGSSELSPEDKQRLSRIAHDEVADGELTLIIGYASETGDAAGNESLSSDRATAAAEYFATQKRAGQAVQAVYLGQTDRFSADIPERNQICEVWKIRRN